MGSRPQLHQQNGSAKWITSMTDSEAATESVPFDIFVADVIGVSLPSCTDSFPGGRAPALDLNSTCQRGSLAFSAEGRHPGIAFRRFLQWGLAVGPPALRSSYATWYESNSPAGRCSLGDLVDAVALGRSGDPDRGCQQRAAGDPDRVAGSSWIASPLHAGARRRGESTSWDAEPRARAPERTDAFGSDGNTYPLSSEGTPYKVPPDAREGLLQGARSCGTDL
jgi:hypothetical protein